MPPRTAIRAATRRTGISIRDQCGFTAIARSSGQDGAIALQACAQAASTAVVSIVVSTFTPQGLGSAAARRAGCSFDAWAGSGLQRVGQSRRASRV